jgi:hypothetical protein
VGTLIKCFTLQWFIEQPHVGDRSTGMFLADEATPGRLGSLWPFLKTKNEDAIACCQPRSFYELWPQAFQNGVGAPTTLPWIPVSGHFLSWF